MAFELSSLPNLNTNIPQTDPVEQFARVASLRNMLSEAALRQALAPSQIQQQQAQAQQAQQQAEMQRIQLQDARIMSDYFKTGDVGQDVGQSFDFSMRDKVAAFTGIDKNDPIMGMLSGLAKKGYSGTGLMAAAQNAIQKRTEYNKGTEELQTIQKNDRTVWEDQLSFLHGLPEDQRSAQLAAKLPLLLENSKSDPILGAYGRALAGHPEMIDQLYNAVTGENSILGLRKAKAEATEAEQKIIGPTGMSAQEQSQVAQKTAELPTELAKVTAETRAREQVQASMLPLMEDIRQQYANQKDARDKIESTVLKPYQDKMTDVTAARAAIVQASDNPVAARAAVFKMIGVAQPAGSHRVLPAEITAFRYPGGIADRVKERFNDFLKGEPWTPEVAAAAESFIQGQENAARSTLNAGIGRNNQLYNTNVGQGLLQQGNAKADAAKLHTNMEDFSHIYTGTKGMIYSDDGKTWYDANGKLVK